MTKKLGISIQKHALGYVMESHILFEAEINDVRRIVGSVTRDKTGNL